MNMQCGLVLRRERHVPSWEEIKTLVRGGVFYKVGWGSGEVEYLGTLARRSNPQDRETVKTGGVHMRHIS